MKRLSVFIYILTLTISSPGSELAPWVSRNVRLGEDPVALPEGTGKNQAEPHAIRSVKDPDLVLATFQEGRFTDGGARNNGYAVSEDGGFTWRRGLNPRLTLVNGGPYFRATDPVGGIALDGTLYLNSLVSVDNAFGLGRLVIQRSEDRGLNWSDPITVYTGTNSLFNDRIFPDKNWMVINDYPDAPRSGRIIITWTNFRTLTEGNINDYLIMSSYSDDRGESWSQPVFVTPPISPDSSQNQYQGSQPVFLPGGGLAIVFHNFFLSRLEVSYSPDGGETFPYSAVGVHDRYFLYDAPNMRDGQFLPSVSVARETGDIYVAYTSTASSTSFMGEIYFTRSDRQDGGGSPASNPDWRFRTPIRISGLSPQRVVALPTIAVSPDGSLVTVYFYDNRNSTQFNNFGDFYAVQSVDGGASWTSPFRLTGKTFDLRRSTSTSRGYMIGDYFGFAAPQGPGQAGIAVWVDTRVGNADPWSARIGGLDGSVFDSWLQANLPYSINKVGAEALRNSDQDGDGAPEIIEYITGRDPLVPEISPGIEDGMEFLVLDAATDTDLALAVSPGTGRWPVFRTDLGMNPTILPFGEGYWSRYQWSTAGNADHFRFSINNQENWFLLDEDSFVRWVLEFPDSWVWSPWFGWLYTQSAPWLFHLSLGWVYDFDGVLYSAALSTYLYPELSAHPWIITQEGNFLYLVEDSPWIYDSGSQSWIRTY